MIIEDLQTIDCTYEIEYPDIIVNEIGEEATNEIIEKMIDVMSTKATETLTNVSVELNTKLSEGASLDDDELFENIAGLDLSELDEEQRAAFAEQDFSTYDFKNATIDWDAIGDEKRQEVEDQIAAGNVDLDLDSLFQTTTNEETGETTSTATMSDVLTQVISNAFVADGVLILYSRDGEVDEQFEDAMTEITEALDEMDTTSLENTVKNTNIVFPSNDATDKEIEESAREVADEISNLLSGGTSDNELANQFVSELNNSTKKGKRFGLWKALYIAMKVVEKLPDISCYLYCIALCLVIALYFTAGVIYISVHFGGAAIIGVGVSLICISIHNIIQGILKMQQGANSSNYLTNLYDHCKGIMDSVDTMYSNGIIIELVIGVTMYGIIPGPFVGIGTKNSIGFSLVKYILLVACIAAYVLLLISAIESNLFQTMKFWNNCLGKIWEDGDDLLACFMSIGIKLSVLLSLTRTTEAPLGSQGVGLLIPIGP